MRTTQSWLSSTPRTSAGLNLPSAAANTPLATLDMLHTTFLVKLAIISRAAAFWRLPCDPLVVQRAGDLSAGHKHTSRDTDYPRNRSFD